jgi:phage tail sheath gpL-like
MSLSTAIGLERVSRIVGYVIKKGNFQTASPNLPIRIAILGEANEANQATLDVTQGEEITSAQKAGELYGFGSPLHSIMRILRPISGDGVGGIPTVAYPQAKASGAAAKIVTITPSGFARGNGVHYLKIAGRDGVDGERYAINVSYNDTVADITAKIEDAVNNVLGCPMSAVSTDYTVTLTSKWKGETADSLQVSVDTGENDFDLAYTIATSQAGAGTPSISASLLLFGNAWNTIVINAYGLKTTVLDDLEDFNGIPDPIDPTGRYTGSVFKPFIALSGSVSDDPSDISDARLDEVTIAICPAPGSAGQQYEAAANMARLFAVVAQNAPNLDVAGKSYPDMPTPVSIGSMADYNNRDAFVKKGCSTVDLVSGKYQVQDFVTTYHKLGELPPQFRYCRNLNLDWNVRYGYFLLELIHVIDHSISNDEDVVSAESVVKPKQWIGVLNQYADDLEKRALIADSAFMTESIEVGISETNPDRFETRFRYKRTGFVRQAATTAEAGFNFGDSN